MFTTRAAEKREGQISSRKYVVPNEVQYIILSYALYQ